MEKLLWVKMMAKYTYVGNLQLFRIVLNEGSLSQLEVKSETAFEGVLVVKTINIKINKPLNGLFS